MLGPRHYQQIYSVGLPSGRICLPANKICMITCSVHRVHQWRIVYCSTYKHHPSFEPRQKLRTIIEKVLTCPSLLVMCKLSTCTTLWALPSTTLSTLHVQRKGCACMIACVCMGGRIQRLWAGTHLSISGTLHVHPHLWQSSCQASQTTR